MRIYRYKSRKRDIMKKLLIFATFLIAVGSQIYGYKVKIFNTVPYTANFFVHTKLAGCCYGDKVGGESKCRKAIGALEEAEINLSGLCTGACWSYVDASVTVPQGKEAYLKRSVPFENESLGCGDARLFVYKNNEGFALGNKAEYIAHLITKLNTLLDDSVPANKPFLKELQLRYTNKVNELDTQIGAQAFAVGNLGMPGIILAQNLLANTLEYAKEFLKIDEAAQLVKKSANQNPVAKLETLTELEKNLNTIPQKDALMQHNQLIDTLRALIYLARLEIAAQDSDKTLLATEMNRELTFPHAPAMAAEIKARIEATQKLYGSNLPSVNLSTPNVPRAQDAQGHSDRASLQNTNTKIDEDNEPAVYTFWVTKLSLPMNDENAKNDLCAIKKYIEKGIKDKGQLSADVPDLLEAIDEWKNSAAENLYPAALLNLINKKLADRKWQCS